MGHTIVLALAAAVYPTILAGVIVILSQPQARQLLIGFLFGGMAMSLAAGFVVLFAIEQSDRVIDLQQKTRPDFEIVIGALSLLVAWVVWTDRAGKLGVRRHQARARGGSVWPAVFTGALLSLPGFWYLAALSGIAEGSAGSEVLQVVVFNVIMFVLVEIPLAIYLINQEQARPRVAALAAWLYAHAREVGAVLATVVGGYLIVKGVFDADMLRPS